VWNGEAVGVDVTTPNKTLAACIDKRVRAVEWRHKVRSLNTVEYSEIARIELQHARKMPPTSA